jgi:hypothetical protein
MVTEVIERHISAAAAEILRIAEESEREVIERFANEPKGKVNTMPKLSTHIGKQAAFAIIGKALKVYSLEADTAIFCCGVNILDRQRLQIEDSEDSFWVICPRCGRGMMRFFSSQRVEG